MRVEKIQKTITTETLKTKKKLHTHTPCPLIRILCGKWFGNEQNCASTFTKTAAEI